MIIHEHNENHNLEFFTIQHRSCLMWQGSSSAFALQKVLLLLMEEKDYRRNLHKFIGKCHLAYVQM